MLKKSIITLIVLSGFGFFEIKIVNPESFKMIDLISIIMGSLVLLFGTQLKLPKSRKYFSFGIMMIFLSVILSIVGALVYQKQEIITSVLVSRSIYYYILYYVLYKVNIQADTLERMVLVFAMLYCGAYLLALVYPKMYFVKIADDAARSVTRVYMPGSLMNILSLFYSLKMIFFNKKYKYTIFVLISITVAIMTGSRMVFFPALFVMVLFIFKESDIGKVHSRVFAFLLIIVAIITLYPIVEGMYNTALNDLVLSSGNNNYSIRTEAVQYYYSMLFPNFFSYITGNGFASWNSEYGMFMELLKTKYGYHQSDIGLFGDFTKLGAFYLLGVFILFKRMFQNNYPKEIKYLKYFFIYVALSCITLSHFGYQEGIVTLCIAFYICDKYKTYQLEQVESK